MDKFVKEFHDSKVIVVCRGVADEEIVNVATALYEGGIRFMEVPFDQGNRASWEATARQIRLVRDALDGKMHVGAGTVITEEQVEIAKNAGAEIIVSPTMEEDVIAATKKAGLISMPGCATPSEMSKAYKLGADLIKLFPPSVISLKTIKEIRIPLCHIPFVCFGGVNAETLKDVLATGVVGVGVGTCVMDKTALKEKDYAKITALAKAITDQI